MPAELPRRSRPHLSVVTVAAVAFSALLGGGGCTPAARGPASVTNATFSVAESSVTSGDSAAVDALAQADAGAQADAVPSDAGAPAETAAGKEAAGPGSPDPLDWPFWRGPRYDGTSPETGLVAGWDPEGGEGSNVLWKREDVGTRSTPIVMNGKLYTLMRAEPETAREGEKVVCLDANTGETIWENRFNVWLSDVPDTRVGWSSVVGDPETGRVYALGVCGYFQCLDGRTGETIWSTPMHERFGLLSTYGGRTNFPVICDDLVIISSVVIGWGDNAKPGHRFVAFDKATGEVVWFNGTRPLPYDTTYSSPILSVIQGQKMLIFGSGDGAVWAFQPRTGRPIWHYDFTMRGINTAPLLVGETVFIGHSEENIDSNLMGAMASIDATKQGDVTTSGRNWQVQELMVGKSSPVAVNGRLYCIDDRAKLHVLDLETGEAVLSRRGKALGTVMRASPLYADGKIYVNTANGRWYVLRPDEDAGVEFESRGRWPQGEECHASPICSHGKVYMQTTGALYCLQDPAREPGATALPEPPAETPVGSDAKPAHVQIVPAEMLIRPGDSRKLTVRLYNADGQFLREQPDARFQVGGVQATVAADGTFTAPSDARHAAAVITATVGDLKGEARARIVPDLPWHFDFEDLEEPPVTWVGARYRHVLRDVDGDRAMVKITTIPKGTRSRCWFGHSDLSDYTIQADVKGAETDNKMPDIGLIAQGYALDLQGASQRLQIRTWVPQERMAKAVPFPWKPDTWYTMKLRASVEGDKAILRGKVWEADQPEPEQWTVEAIDEAPNRSGSPGLYGNAKDAEIILDDIKVFANSA